MRFTLTSDEGWYLFQTFLGRDAYQARFDSLLTAMKSDGMARAAALTAKTRDDHPVSWHAGNADLDGTEDGGWFFGSFMAGRVPARTSEHLEVKWARLAPGSQDEQWTAPEAETSLCVLVTGSQRLCFREGEVVLATPGDYVIWFPGEQHTWQSSTTEETTTITIRWPSTTSK